VDFTTRISVDGTNRVNQRLSRNFRYLVQRFEAPLAHLSLGHPKSCRVIGVNLRLAADLVGLVYLLYTTLPSGRRTMPRTRAKQESPIVFRPGPELKDLVTSFASRHRVSINEAFKFLSALAVVGLDVRCYDLIAHIGALLTGPNKFVRAAHYVNSALLGAAQIRGSIQFADRIVLIVRIARDVVEQRGASLPEELVQQLCARLGISYAPEMFRSQPEEWCSTASDQSEPLHQRIGLS
jgi:hypothetical protein